MGDRGIPVKSLTHANPARSDDPGLADLVDGLTARLHAGEPVDLGRVLRDHPAYADELRELFPALQALARVGSGAAPAPPAEARAPVHGQLGDYRILREVGRGGMGVVYEAEQVSLQRRVALKVLPFAATLHPKQIVRFKNEALAAAQLHHTNIVPVFAVGCERGVHYYAMQFIDGRTLAAVVAELRKPVGAALDEDDALAVTRADPARALVPRPPSAP